MAHITVPDIRWVNWHALKAAGFKGCVFDKDNTLTEPYAVGVHETLEASLQDCMKAFDGHVALLSNSAGLQEFDPKGVCIHMYIMSFICKPSSASHRCFARLLMLLLPVCCLSASGYAYAWFFHPLCGLPCRRGGCFDGKSIRDSCS